MESKIFSIDAQPYSSLFKIYNKEFLSQSVEKGWIDTSRLSIAGDGTPVVTSAWERKKRVCDCSEKGITDCDCDRYFPNQTVTSDGIPPRTVFIMDMIFICWSPPIRKATSLCFLL